MVASDTEVGKNANDLLSKVDSHVSMVLSQQYAKEPLSRPQSTEQQGETLSNKSAGMMLSKSVYV